MKQSRFTTEQMIAILHERTSSAKRLAVTRARRPPVRAPNDTWGIDFVSDTLCSGRRFRACTVVDVCTHECVAITAARSLPSNAVIAALQRVIADRVAPIPFAGQSQ